MGKERESASEPRVPDRQERKENRADVEITTLSNSEGVKRRTDGDTVLSRSKEAVHDLAVAELQRRVRRVDLDRRDAVRDEFGELDVHLLLGGVGDDDVKRVVGDGVARRELVVGVDRRLHRRATVLNGESDDSRCAACECTWLAAAGLRRPGARADAPATAERVAVVQSSADLAPRDLAADCAMCTCESTRPG